MAAKARRYTNPTLRRLYTLSGNQCAAPNCNRTLFARDGISFVGEICHIEAVSKKGPRYNSEMTDAERKDTGNLILLCSECHTIIDNKENEDTYPVSRLKEWKANHESKRLHALRSNTSLLSLVIERIANVNFDDMEVLPAETSAAFNIEDKISHNAIKENKALIDDYKVLYSKLGHLYEELELQGSFKKEKLLRNIGIIYSKTKGKYVGNSTDPMQLIRDNADNIIDDVLDTLIASCESYPFHSEDIAFGVSIIVVDAFMRCKILEEPPRE